MLNSSYLLVARRAKRANQLQAENPDMSRYDALKQACEEITK